MGIDTRMRSKSADKSVVYVGKSIISVRSGSGAAEIVELAGTRTDTTLSRNLSAKYGAPGRLLWHVFNSANIAGKVEPEIREAVREAEVGLQNVLDRISSRAA